jgi:hypothetical protein
MTTSTRGLAILASALVFAVSTTSACSLLEPAAVRLDLRRTSWSVGAIDERPVGLRVPLLIRFDTPVPDSVTVVTGCRTATVPFAMDTDGSALSFERLPERPGSCAPELAAEDDALTRVLNGLQEWRVINQNQIELLGAGVVRLQRATNP